MSSLDKIDEDMPLTFYATVFKKITDPEMIKLSRQMDMPNPTATRPQQVVTPVTRPAVEFLQAQAYGPTASRVPSSHAFLNKAKRGFRPVDGNVEEVIMVTSNRSSSFVQRAPNHFAAGLFD